MLILHVLGEVSFVVLYKARWCNIARQWPSEYVFVGRLHIPSIDTADICCQTSPRCFPTLPILNKRSI